MQRSHSLLVCILAASVPLLGCGPGSSLTEDDDRRDGGTSTYDTGTADTGAQPDDTGIVVTHPPDSDTGVMDTNITPTDTGEVADSGSDTGAEDSGTPEDSGVPTDTGLVDSGSTDTGTTDTGTTDTGTLPDTPAGCPADGLGESSLASPHVIAGNDAHYDANACSPDWFAIDMEADERLTVALNYGHVDETIDIDIKLFDAAGNQLAVSEETTGHEEFAYDTDIARRVFLKVFDYYGEGGDYAMTLNVRGGTPTGDMTATGRIAYEDRPVIPGSSGPGSPVVTDARAVVVEVVETSSGRTVGAGVTNASGSYSVPFDGANGNQYYVRVPARIDGAR